MQLHENGRFLLLTLGVFLLTLGAAVSLCALIERVFFELSFGKLFALLAGGALLAGALLLRYGRRRLV